MISPRKRDDISDFLNNTTKNYNALSENLLSEKSGLQRELNQMWERQDKDDHPGQIRQKDSEITHLGEGLRESHESIERLQNENAEI